MKRLLVIALWMFAVMVSSKAQTWQKTGTGIKATVNNVDVEIQFYAPSTVRIIKYPLGQVFNKKSLSKL